MSNITIYLAGAMSGLQYDEYMCWRVEFSRKIHRLIYDCDIDQKIRIFNPCMYYNYDEKYEKTEREPFEFDIYNLKRSDLIVANLNRQDSIGTCMELAIAKDNMIPVVGLHENDDSLHPWVSECCIRVCDSMDELVQYVVNYYIV